MGATQPTMTNLETHLQEVLDENIEQFRRDASDAYRSYAPEDRKIIARLRGRQADAHTFFERWIDTWQAQCRHLNKPAQRSLVRAMVTTFGVTEQEAHDKIVDLKEAYRRELIHACLKDVYGKDVRKRQRKATETLFTWEETQVESLRERYEYFRAYSATARENHVTVFDPYAPIIKRVQLRRRIRKETSKLMKKESARLKVIDRRLDTLYRQDGGRIGRIMRTGIDVVAIVAARADYEKTLQKMSPSKRRSPVVRSDLYISVTKSLREGYGGRHGGDHLESLAEARHIMTGIDDIIIEIFDLSNSQTNILMSDMKTVRDLMREKETLLLKRQQRLQVAKQVF